MDYEQIEKAKADLKTLNKVEREVMAAYETVRRNVGMLEQIPRDQGTTDEWRALRETKVKARAVLKRFPTPEYLASIRAVVLGRIMVA
ncbi:hypothetical protein SAMN02799636_04324 [Methylobacterium sp. 275MFSha3.1]|uniref:hypothetical protein n=1 Tax=Methylobacterium sp. 275MFSha3.1 TaxID=1502746 RepID=UPI0008A7E9C1|nr:hypothetical protein [Methylobacterium sp. 275MFSha3.1]SEH89338.1 hypothetical protein SAMN02799636_04324 [Methylobacterium sp. 275MFSha3.1]